ncbi:hypothetical protein PMI42_03797, partial [Bradyrhizobium sp. YR681]
MSRRLLIGTAAAIFTAAGATLFAGSSHPLDGTIASEANAADTAGPLYYQDP